MAVALAMDAFAVSIAAGIKKGGMDRSMNSGVNSAPALRMTLYFGLFQAGMFIIGWLIGHTVKDIIDQYDHWVAFFLLLYVSQDLFRASFKEEKEEVSTKDPTKGWTLILLSLATSLDAMAVGFSLSVVGVDVWTSALIIGLTASAFTAVGWWGGRRLSRAVIVRRYADGIGGLILLVIGVSILYHHGVFGG